MFELTSLGEAAIVIRLGDRIEEATHRRITALTDLLDRQPFPGLIEYIPAFTTVTVFYDPLRVLAERDAQASAQETVRGWLRGLLGQLHESGISAPVTVEIPVCYGGEFGPDLEFVAQQNGLTPEEVIQIHAAGEYLVYMIGFAPGFPYLGGMSDKIAAPRRPSPRLKIPRGTVGIAGMQTGIYPIETPGGWQLIGRSPVALFRPHTEQPSLLQAGNIVRFRPISPAEYAAWEEETP